MKRLAIPIVNNVLSEAFGQCSSCFFFDIEEKRATHSFQKQVPADIDTSRLPDWFRTEGATDIVFHNVDASIVKRFIELKINVFVGIELLPTNVLLEKFENGSLTSNSKKLN